MSTIHKALSRAQREKDTAQGPYPGLASGISRDKGPARRTLAWALAGVVFLGVVGYAGLMAASRRGQATEIPAQQNGAEAAHSPKAAVNKEAAQKALPPEPANAPRRHSGGSSQEILLADEDQDIDSWDLEDEDVGEAPGPRDAWGSGQGDNVREDRPPARSKGVSSPQERKARHAQARGFAEGEDGAGLLSRLRKAREERAYPGPDSGGGDPAPVENEPVRPSTARSRPEAVQRQPAPEPGSDSRQVAALSGTALAERWYELALKSQLEGNAEEAGAYYETSLAADPKYAPSLNNRAVLAMEAGDLATAREGFDEAMKADPEYADPCYNLACLHARQGQAEEALSFLQMAAGMDRQVADWARDDEDLAILRDAREFQAIVGPASGKDGP